MEDIVRVFFGAKNEIGYLHLSLSPDRRINRRGEASYVVVHPERPAWFLEQVNLSSIGRRGINYLEMPTANLKKYHAQGEPLLGFYASMPIKIDLSFLESFLVKLPERISLIQKA